ncbi:hypothetical protein QBC38DRAFT_449267 [Podospora fimiseda]|uniref:Uncharacterized protein n=1 Tax=Podospora fimiseda TaxID=252190 RepID=A0AAN6YL83_9PEZI|nr:hypothetical protein QBC38DRAFT_449267 [Podospora fimiseda]
MLLSYFFLLGAAYALPQVGLTLPGGCALAVVEKYTLNRIGSYGGSGNPINICTGPQAFTFRAGKYPSTTNRASSDPENEIDDGHNDTPKPAASSAPDLDVGVLRGSTKDKEFIDTSDSTAPLGGPPGKPVRALLLQTFTAPQSTGGRQNVYHTEHVFELHIMKDFFVWLVRNYRVSCSEVFNVFGKLTSALYDQDIGGSVANEMMLQLAWHDTDFPGGIPEVQGNVILASRLNHFFVLKAGLNNLKASIMNGRTLDERDTHEMVLPAPTTWNNCVKTFDEVKVVMDYLRDTNVIAAWRDATVSVQQYLDKTLVKAITGDTRPWSTLWKTFINAWVDKRSQDPQNWHDLRNSTCSDLGRRDPAFNANFQELKQLEQFIIRRWAKEEYTLPAGYKLP